jgi:hypothetical protein
MTASHSTTVLPSIPPHLIPALKALRDDLVGLLGVSHGGGRGASSLGYVRMAAGAASGGGAGVAAASIPANRMTTLADQYGYQ